MSKIKVKGIKQLVDGTTQSLSIGGVLEDNSDEVLNIASNGDLQVKKVIQTNGIKFPAVQVPSADPNTFDDYEEGVWTPIVTASTGTITTIGAVFGTYTKIGRLVYVTFNIVITANGTGATSIKVSGLPFNIVERGFGVGVETDVVGFNTLINGINGTNYALVTKPDNTYPGGTSYRLIGSFTYMTT